MHFFISYSRGSQYFFFFFSSRRRHTRFKCDWSSDVCSSDLGGDVRGVAGEGAEEKAGGGVPELDGVVGAGGREELPDLVLQVGNASHVTSVAFSPDGKLLASGLKATEVTWLAFPTCRTRSGSSSRPPAPTTPSSSGTPPPAFSSAPS